MFLTGAEAGERMQEVCPCVPQNYDLRKKR